MGFHISLRHRIYFLLTAVVIITAGGALVMVWYTYRMESLLTAIVQRDMAALQTAENLEIALVNQKGFVSYYFLDGDPEWLRRLGEYRQIFRERLNEALGRVENPAQQSILDQIDRKYGLYITNKDQVIDYYKTGRRSVGAELHQQVRDHFFQILELCEEYKTLYADRVLEAREESHSQAVHLRIVAGAAMILELILAMVLAAVLVVHILGPVRRLTLEADGGSLDDSDFGNEIKALSRSVQGLIEDAGQTHIELERSREHLLQSEKMALVGRLAAGTAHSIRNPLTSVKMRLFSLSRSLRLTPPQQEDFDVIAQETKHIDTIVQNFLEFARPPKLQIQRVSPSGVVDMTIQLLAYRLRSYDVTVHLRRDRPLPPIAVDPEQLKEVLVNLMVNACEAMCRGGEITIAESETPPPNRNVVIRVTDNGPGMSETVRNQIFNPFYTTKEEGTGLGLSIVLRIIEEHGGRIEVQSEEGAGTTFTIILPAAGDTP